jgi:hypothetical protein
MAERSEAIVELEQIRNEPSDILQGIRQFFGMQPDRN